MPKVAAEFFGDFGPQIGLKPDGCHPHQFAFGVEKKISQADGIIRVCPDIGIKKNFHGRTSPEVFRLRYTLKGQRHLSTKVFAFMKWAGSCAYFGSRCLPVALTH